MSFVEKCGCEWHAGEWFNCSAHPEKCEVCQSPVTPAMRGICPTCLDIMEVSGAR